MLFDASVSKTRGSFKQAHGFMILRHSLFLSCAQDIAKLSLDSDRRTPSIHNVIDSLSDISLRKELENRYSVWVVPSIENDTDPEIIIALKQMESRERKERRVQFTEHYAELIGLWASVSSSKTMEGFADVRDKVSAHTEVRFVAAKYQLIDIGTLGIKWGDMNQTIESMERLVELIGLIVRNAGFAWEALDRQLTTAAMNFWGTSDAVS
jgi:hypothetical protein